MLIGLAALRAKQEGHQAEVVRLNLELQATREQLGASHAERGAEKAAAEERVRELEQRSAAAHQVCCLATCMHGACTLTCG